MSASAEPGGGTDAPSGSSAAGGVVGVPTLASVGIAPEEVSAACAVLEKLAAAGAPGLALFNATGRPPMRRLRKAVAPLLEEMRRKFGVGLDEREHKRRAKKRLNARKHQEKALDRKYKDKTRLRAERLAHLNSLMEQGSQLLIPDGPSERADVGSTGAGTTGNALKDSTSAPKVASGSAGAAASSSASPSSSLNANEDASETLHRPRSCYICKSRFYRLHHFYDQLCPACAELNYTRRTRKCDLAGRVCLVTGGRVKIGYQVVLKLLRSNATVIATTRFPRDAAARYAKELDYQQWSQRLHIFGLDFRYIPGVRHFATSCGLDRLDVIINNATQTSPPPLCPLVSRREAALHLLPPAQQSTLRSDRASALREQMRAPSLGNSGMPFAHVADSRPPVLANFGQEKAHWGQPAAETSKRQKVVAWRLTWKSMHPPAVRRAKTMSCIVFRPLLHLPTAAALAAVLVV